MGPSSRTAASLASIVLILASCSSVAPTPTPSPTPELEPAVPSTSVYGRLFDRIGPNGEVDKDLALQAFSVAIAPLPGVALPQGDAPAPYEIKDGTFAVDWLMRYYDQLTPEQRAAADAALTPRPDDPIVTPGAATSVSLLGAADTISLAGAAIEVADERQPYIDALKESEGLIAGRLGRKLRLPWSLTVNDAQVGGTWSLAYTHRFSFPGLGTVGCQFHVNPVLPKRFGAVEMAVTMAHEMFHCFQVDLVGPTEPASWIMEGQAEWVGEALKGPSVAGSGWWRNYLVSPGKVLYSRTYDASGFYWHLREVGIDPWPHLDAMLKAADNAEAFKMAGATSDAFLDSWASGFLQEPSVGSAWDAKSLWTVKDRAELPSVTVDADLPTPVSATPASSTLYAVSSGADIVEVRIEGHGRLETPEGDLVDLGQRWLCTKAGGCACPAGQHYEGPDLVGANGFFHLGVSGGVTSTTGMLSGHKLEEFCQPDESPRPSGSGGPASKPCPQGCAQSNGDPHLTTVDNHHYEFQAAGEYTLLRSADGSIEIQSRQEPPDPTKPVTVNTAVAARVNGHKVGVYVVDDTVQLHIDGVITTDSAPVDLGDGAMVEPHEHGYQLTFPDGTVLTMLSLGKWGINAIVKPSVALKTGGGLLGSVVPGGAELPALPDGTRLPRPTTIHETFQQTYGQLAPAWLVTSTTTLFDYDPGKDTSSYLIAGFPDEASLSLLNNLPPELQAKARLACAGVTDLDLLDQCAFDFAVTSAVAYAQLYGITANFVQNGTAALDQPAPSGPLPAGFFDIAPSLAGLRGAAFGPTGTLYVSLDLGSDQFEVQAVDPATGTVSARADVPSAGMVKVAAGSVWVGGIDANFDCMIQRLDAGTLSLQATIPVPCDITAADFTVLDDAVWFVDRTFDGGQTEAVRRIDPTTNQLDTEVALPFFNGFLGSTGSTMSYGDLTNGFFRLHPGERAFQPFGAVPADLTFGVTFGVVLAGDGYWVQHDQSAVFYSSSKAPDRTVPIDGTMVSADEQAVYVESSDPTDGTSTLWRYPGDGSAPAQIGRGATVDGQDLGYFDNDPFLVGAGAAVKLWSVLSPSGTGPWELIEQYLPLP